MFKVTLVIVAFLLARDGNHERRRVIVLILPEQSFVRSTKATNLICVVAHILHIEYTIVSLIRQAHPVRMWLSPGRAEIRNARLCLSASRRGFLAGDQRDSGGLCQLLILLQVVIQDVELAVDLTYILLEQPKFFLNDALLLQLVISVVRLIIGFSIDS